MTTTSSELKFSVSWAMAVTSDYSSGLIRLLVQAQPNRLLLLGGKIIALVAFTCLSMLVATVAVLVARGVQCVGVTQVIVLLPPTRQTVTIGVRERGVNGVVRRLADTSAAQRDLGFVARVGGLPSLPRRGATGALPGIGAPSWMASPNGSTTGGATAGGRRTESR